MHLDPWRLLVACVLLNKTTRRQVDPVIWRLFARYPTAADMAGADKYFLADLLKPLGTYRKRAMGLIRMSEEYLAPGWTRARELFGVGKYGDDAWHLFVVGDWEAVRPNDYALAKYWKWLQERQLAARLRLATFGGKPVAPRTSSRPRGEESADRR